MLVIAPWPSSCLLRPHIRSMALRALQVVADYLAGPSRTGLATTCARLASSGLLQSLQAPTLSPAVTACSCSSVQQTSGLRTITDVHASREESSTAVFNGCVTRAPARIEPSRGPSFTSALDSQRQTGQDARRGSRCTAAGAWRHHALLCARHL